MTSVAVVMPTIPRRASSAQAVIESLLPQCDRFYVHLDGYDAAPPWMPTKKVRCFVHPQHRGPAVRYSLLPEEDVVFFVDDDIEYPRNYVKRSRAALSRLGPRRAIAYHAAWWPEDSAPQYRRRVLVGYWDEAAEDQVVTYVGSGTLALRSADLRDVDLGVPQQFAFQDDVWISSALARASIRCVRPRSKRNWIRSTGASGSGLYAEASKDGFRQRDACIADALALGSWKLAR